MLKLEKFHGAENNYSALMNDINHWIAIYFLILCLLVFFNSLYIIILYKHAILK